MNILCYLLSCMIFSLGATSFIFSDLGTDPLDVFCLGIQNHFDIKIGTIQSFFALFCLLIYSFLNKWKIPPLSTGITSIICGYMIDFFRLSLDYFKDFNSYVLLFFGCAFCLQGSAGIILSGIGIRAMDLVALSLEEITKKPFWLYKGIAEVILLFTGWILGGPVGIGTVLFLLTVGWLIQPVINLNKKLFNI